MIKYILFDLGGVVIDFYNEDDYYPYISRISGMREERVARIINYDIRVDLDRGTVPQKVFERKMMQQFGIKRKQIQWYEFYTKKATLYRGTLDIISRLHGKYKVGYLSNTDRSRYTYTVGKLLKPYLKLFDYRFASCDIHLRKPGKEIYRYALRRMHAKAGETVFIDNQIENVVGANKAGIKSILFTNAKDLEKRLRKMGIGL
jgi:putative hydrolase of the HAD superfamily